MLETDRSNNEVDFSLSGREPHGEHVINAQLELIKHRESTVRLFFLVFGEQGLIGQQVSGIEQLKFDRVCPRFHRGVNQLNGPIQPAIVVNADFRHDPHRGRRMARHRDERKGQFCQHHRSGLIHRGRRRRNR